MKLAMPLRKFHRQQGVTAIEFAILFPVFFMILYGIITYGMIFAAQQSLTLAAEEGARTALQYIPSSSANAALTARGQAAQTACLSLLSWMQAMSGGSNNVTCSATTATSGCPNSTMYCIKVTAQYGSYSTYPLVPAVWPLNTTSLLPSQLGNTATVQLDPANII